MKTLTDYYFTLENQQEPPIRALMKAGSGEFKVPGRIINALWNDRLSIAQFIDCHYLYDNSVDKHYVCLRYIATDGMVVSVIPDSVKIPEYILDPVVEWFNIADPKMNAGEEITFTKDKIVYTLKAEAV